MVDGLRSVGKSPYLQPQEEVVALVPEAARRRSSSRTELLDASRRQQRHEITEHQLPAFKSSHDPVTPTVPSFKLCDPAETRLPSDEIDHRNLLDPLSCIDCLTPSTRIRVETILWAHLYLRSFVKETVG